MWPIVHKTENHIYKIKKTKTITKPAGMTK